MSSRLASRSVVAAFAFAALYFSGTFPPFSNPNELSRIEAVYSAAELSTFRIDDAIPIFGDHEDKSVYQGHFYSNKAPGLSLAATPVYRLLRLFFGRPKTAADPIFFWLRLLTVSSICTLALARFLRRLEPSPAAALVGLAVAFGTPFLFYARTFFAHAWVASLLFLSWDLIRAARDREGSQRVSPLLAAAGFLAGWAAISEYTVAPLVVILAISTRASRRFAPFAAGASLPICALLAYDAACFGSLFTLSSSLEAHAGYSQVARKGLFGVGWPSFPVAAAFLVHPARGLLLFSPFWAWAVPGFLAWRRNEGRRGDAILLLVAAAGFFAILTGYTNWHGGWSLGNRYLLPVLFLAGLGLPHALASPVSRGVFAVAALFAVLVHLWMTASWVHFPLDLGWPPANGTLWFLTRGWVARNVLSGLGGRSLLLPAIAVAVAGGLAVRAAAPLKPPSAAVLAAALLLFGGSLAAPPRLNYTTRLWRAAIFGAYSGQDPERRELARVVEEAATPVERRQAAGAWRLYGPPSREK